MLLRKGDQTEIAMQIPRSMCHCNSTAHWSSESLPDFGSDCFPLISVCASLACGTATIACWACRCSVGVLDFRFGPATATRAEQNNTRLSVRHAQIASLGPIWLELLNLSVKKFIPNFANYDQLPKLMCPTFPSQSAEQLAPLLHDASLDEACNT